MLLSLTVLTIVGYTYLQNSKAILELSDDLISQVNETVIERTFNYLSPAAVMAQASRHTVKTPSLVDNQELESYGIEILHLYPQLAGFFIGNERGDFLFTKRFPDGSIGTKVIDRGVTPPIEKWTYRDVDGNVTDVQITTEFTYDPRQRPWYQGAKATLEPYWTDIYIFFTDQKAGMTAAYPIIDQQDEQDEPDKQGKLISVVGIDIALDDLSQFLQTQKIGQSGVAFIINDKAEIVAYPGISLAAQEGEKFRPRQISELEVESVRAAYQEHEKTGESRFTLENGGIRYIASFTRFPERFGKRWCIVIVVPEDDFIGGIKRSNQISLLISFVIFVVAIISALFISRSISRPIALLSKETKKIKDFQLDSNLQIHSHISEVQHLSESISTMRNSLQAFQKYVPAELVRQLIETGEDAQLGGDKRELTILFCDIAGFTAISELMAPEELMFQLSRYMGQLATIIMEEQGTVDKYMGDGLMAFWGAPLPNPDHAYYACRAALRCREKVAELNQKWQATGKHAFPIRIGVHTGETLVGNIGSNERMNYTVLGDSVNLASRLESVNKIYGTQILISQATYQQVADKFHCRPVDLVIIKGKKKKVLVYELIGEVGHTPPEQVEFGETFTKGFEAYLAQEWNQARYIFQTLAQQEPSDLATHLHLSHSTTMSHHRNLVRD
ncbi:MAG: adenylate/guanylate cyclase domain-containing protein [Ardenticatenaceae bacterium]